ncbi:lipid-A-disaccharide synthase [Synechococcus sp. CC9605]|uniref:lipid-A-disaccharide synthase n=1 Tax=Synechococcus sp. (strain CC9605) TaxID=110662 RepID=UPI00005D5D60|nr:lipid-A-disaccharide synthase [Synechococcus sp. CC9605]ABB35854.1 lipid-A-disaccharide synthase [Synechococcus sp. CC9605]
MVRLLISTGEVSGDLQGSLLIRALRLEAERRGLELELLALGGPRMEAAGAALIADTAPMGAIGLWEAVPLILPTLRLQARVDALLAEHSLDGVVLIDYVGANVRLGTRLRRQQPELPITYYIAPQEWAWRFGDGSTTRLLGFTDKILAIFPAEAEFYAARGADVSWVGHPLLDSFQNLPDRARSRRQLGLDPEAPVLLLLPASRPQELRYLMPPLAQAAALLQQRHPDLQVLLPAGLAAFEAPLAAALQEAGVRHGRVIPAAEADGLKTTLCAAADLALGKSGTVNLELALQGVPQVVGYRVSRLTAWVACHVLRFQVDHISPVNLLLKQRLVPELLQDELTAEALVERALPLLTATPERHAMLEGYDRLRATLGAPGVTERAAKAIFDQVID